MVNIGDRCEVQIGGCWFPGTVTGIGLGPKGELISVDFDIQGARCNVTENKLRMVGQASLLGGTDAGK